MAQTPDQIVAAWKVESANRAREEAAATEAAATDNITVSTELRNKWMKYIMQCSYYLMEAVDAIGDTGVLLLVAESFDAYAVPENRPIAWPEGTNAPTYPDTPCDNKGATPSCKAEQPVVVNAAGTPKPANIPEMKGIFDDVEPSPLARKRGADTQTPVAQPPTKRTIFQPKRPASK